ncbi:Ig-like domain-containing protein, partial [Rheinheimera mesophila]
TLSLTLTDGSDNTSNPATATIQKDATAPAGYSASITPATIDKSNEAAVGIQLSNAEVGATYSYSISSSGGGTAVTGSGTVSTASALIGGINATALPEGTLTLTVTLTDAAGNSGDAKTATATKSYAAAPVITQGEAIAVSMSEDGAPNAFSLTLNATDANSSDTLSWSIKTAAGHGEASVSGAGNSKVISYVPDTDFSGSDSFEVQVSDGALTDSIVVNVTVEAKNDAPTLAEENSWRVIGTAGFSAQETYTNRIAVSASGKIYVAHLSAGILSIKTWEQGQWLQLGESLTAFGREESLSLALSPDAVPYVGYVSSNGTTVRRFNGSEWELVGIEGMNKNATAVPKLIVEEDGIPYVAFVSSPVKTTIMKFTDGAWTLAGELNMSRSSFEFAVAKGIAYLAFGGNGEPVTVTAFENGEPYSLGQEGLNSYNVSRRSLATDADGKPYLAVFHVVEQRAEITLLTLNASEQWQAVGQALEVNYINSMQLVFAADNTPCLGIVAGGGTAVVRQRDGKMEQVGESDFYVGSSGSFSLALGADGTPYVAYQDRATNNKTTVQTYGIAELGSELYVSEDAKALQLLKGITLSDAEGDAITLTLSLSDTKAGTISGTASGNATLAYNKDTGVLTLTGTVADVNASLASIVFSPAANYSGSFNFTLELSDGQAAISKVTTSVVVAKVNDAPVITGAPQTSVNEDEPYSFTPAATDVDGDKLTYGISNKPVWAEFDASTGKLSGTPGNEHVGTTQNIGISVTDGAFTVYLRSFNLTVVNVNDAPVFTAIPNITLNENEDLTYTLDLSSYLTDADGDELSLSISDSINQLASEYSFDGMKLEMNFDGVKSGSVDVSLSAADGKGGSATTTFKLTVVAENDIPVVEGTPESVEMNSSQVKAVSLVGLVSDEESSFGRGLTLTAQDWSYGTITEKDGILTLKSNADANGQQRVNLTLTDSGTASNEDNKASVQIELEIRVNLVQPSLALTGSCITELKVYLSRPFELDLNSCFKGPVGQQLSMSAVSTKPAAVQVSIDAVSNKLTLTGSKAGELATVTVTAATTTGATQDLIMAVQVVDAVAPVISKLERVELNTTGTLTVVTELQLLEKVEGNSLLEKKQNLVQSGTGIPVISKINGHARGSAEWHKRVSASGELLLGSGNHTITWQLTDVAGGKSTEVQQELWLWPQLSVSLDKSEVVYPGDFDITYSLDGQLPTDPDFSTQRRNNLRSFLGTGFLSGSCIDYGYYVISTDSEAYDKGRTYSPPILTRGSGFGSKPTTDISCNASLTVFGYTAYRNRHPDPESSAVSVTIKPEAKANQPISAVIQFKSSLVLSGVTSTELDVADNSAVFNTSVMTLLGITSDDISTTTGISGSRVSISSLTSGLSLSAPTEQVGLTDVVSYPVTLIKTDQGYQLQLPDGLEPGVYQLALEYSNEYGQKGSSNLVLSVVESLPELLPTNDTDSDGLLDTEEGLRDSNGNGIVDYLDLNTLASQLQLSLQDNAALQCQAGRLCALGAYALAAGADGAALTQTEWQLVSNVGPDEDYQPVSDIFDFVIRQLPSVGSSTAVVLPLSQPVPAGAVYRKFANGQWNSFVEDELNQLHSAPSNAAGACPSPRSPAYRPGLNAGDYCMQLTLQDGGPNDADGIANGEIFDPGVLALQGNQLPEPQADVLTLKLNSSGVINLLANDTDPDGDTLELTNVRGFSGTLQFSADGLVQLSPPQDFVGTLSFSYQVADSEGALAESTLEVTISPNSLPVGVADIARTTNNVTITIDVLANDTDADGDRLSLQSGSAGEGQVLVVDNKLRYVPKAGFVGTDTVSYRVADEWQGVAEGSLTVTVEAYPEVEPQTKSSGAGIGGLMLGLLAAAAWRRKTYQRCGALR